jgi:hypothetical protein
MSLLQPHRHSCMGRLSQAQLFLHGCAVSLACCTLLVWWCMSPLNVHAQSSSAVQRVSSSCTSGFSLDAHSVPGIVYFGCLSPQKSLRSFNLDTGIETVIGTDVTLCASGSLPEPLLYVATPVTALRYGCSEPMGGVKQIRLSNNVISVLATGTQCTMPRSITSDASGNTFVGCGQDNGVIKITSAGVVTTLVSASACEWPYDVEVLNTYVYVACLSDNLIRVPISGGIAQIVTAHSSSNILFDASGTNLYYSGSTSVMKVSNSGGPDIALTTNAQCEFPGSLAWADSAQTFIYVACQNSGIVRIHLNTNTVIQMAPVTQCSPSVLSVTSAGVLYMQCASGLSTLNHAVVVLDTTMTCGDIWLSNVGMVPGGAEVQVSCKAGVFRIVGSNLASMALPVCTHNFFTILFDDVTGEQWSICGIPFMAIRNYTIVNQLSTCSETPTPNVLLAHSGVLYYGCGDTVNSPLTALSNGVWTSLLTVSQCHALRNFAIRSSTNTLYAACGSSGALMINLSTYVVSFLPTIPISDCYYGIDYISVSAAGVVYLGCPLGPTAVFKVSAIVTKLISSAECEPQALMIDNSGAQLYLSCSNTGSIVRFTPAASAGKMLALTSDGQCASTGNIQLSLDVSTGILYAACGSSGLLIITSAPNCAPGYGYRLGTCLPCSAGSYRDRTMVLTLDSVSCTICHQDSVAPNMGMEVCTVCEAGKFLVDPVAPCVSCPIGTYSNASGRRSCTSCPGGRWGQVAELPSDACSGVCPSGYFCPPNSVHPTLLPCNSAALYCPPGSNVPIAIPDGMIGSASMNNTFLTYSSIESCPIGSACTGGMQRTCEPGTFQNQTSQRLCMKCSPGSFSGTNSTICDLCTSGTFASLAGSATCSLCPPGRSSSSEGSVICGVCPIGRTSIGGNHSCEVSPLGYYAPTSESSFPIICAIGMFQNVTGSSGCFECSAGSYQFGQGASSCALCPIGTYTADWGRPVCENCADGWVSDVGFSSCSLCEAGRYARVGVATCLQCNAGTAQPFSGQTSCIECKLGSSSEAGALNCSRCPPGSVSRMRAAIQCEPCFAGYAQSQSGMSNCTACPAGSASPVIGSVTCSDCTVGRYAPTAASSTCLQCDTAVSLDRRNCSSSACPVNFEYGVGGCTMCALGMSTSTGMCAPCQPNFYTPIRGTDCISCLSMEGLVCSNGLASVSAGYWAFQVEQIVDGNSMLVFNTAPCPVELCPGAMLQLPMAGNNTAFISMQSSLLASQCSYPRVWSPLCGQCAQGYIPWGPSCVRCPSNVQGDVIVLVLVLSYALVILFLLSDPSSAGFVHILLYFIQIAMLMVGPLSTWISFLSFVNFDAQKQSSRCIANLNPYQQLLLSLMMPIIMIAQLMSVLALHLSIRWTVAQFHPLPNLLQRVQLVLNHVNYARYRAASLLLLLFCFTQVSTACIGFFQCVNVGNASVLYTMPSVHCDAPEYYRYRAVVITVAVIFVAGFPIMSTLFLATRLQMVRAAVQLALQQRIEGEAIAAATQERKIRMSIVELAAAHAASARRRDTQIQPNDLNEAEVHIFLQRYGPLFASFHARAWPWTALTLARRVLLTAASLALTAQPMHQHLAFLLINFYSLVGHVYLQPFITHALNNAETLSHVTLVTVSAMIMAFPIPYSLPMQVLLLFLVLPVGALLALLAFRDVRPALLHLAHRLTLLIVRARATLRLTSTEDDGPAISKKGDAHTIDDDELRQSSSLGMGAASDLAPNPALLLQPSTRTSDFALTDSIDFGDIPHPFTPTSMHINDTEGTDPVNVELQVMEPKLASAQAPL